MPRGGNAAGRPPTSEFVVAATVADHAKEVELLRATLSEAVELLKSLRELEIDLRSKLDGLSIRTLAVEKRQNEKDKDPKLVEVSVKDL